MMAQEGALKGVANSKLRRLLAYKKTFNCSDVKIGDSVLCYGAFGRESLPMWSGPARILDTDETGATQRHQSQAFEVARYCVRKRAPVNEMGDVARPPR